MKQAHPIVAVIMSTYNGARFLVEQIESVLAQRDVQVRLYVRDDGSTDETLQILEGFEREGRLTLERGENMGVVPSFIRALSMVPSDIEFIALCDQDDVWHRDKLTRAVRELSKRGQDVPLLYCSEYMFCDSDMQPLGRSHLNRIGVNFETLLYETMVSGNTTVINRRLAELAIAAGSEGVYSHDWWLGLIAAGLGELMFDDFISLDYRRTGGTVSPTGASPVTLLLYRVRKFLAGGDLVKITGQLQRYYQCFGGDLPEERRRLIERFLQGGRLRKALAPVRLRQKPLEEVALRVLFLTGAI